MKKQKTEKAKRVKKVKNRTGSLKKRMLLFFLTTMTVILAIVAVVILNSVSSTIVTLNNDITTQVVLARADEVGKYVQGIVYDVQTMAQRSEFKPKYIQNIRSILEKIQANLRPDIEMVLYSDMQGSFYSSLGTRGSIADRDYFKELQNGGKSYAISNPLTSKVTGKTVFVVAQVVKDDEGKGVGIFAATILLDTFNETIAEIKIGDGGFPWIMDNTGLVIAHPDENVKLQMNARDSAEAGYQGLDKIAIKMVMGISGLEPYTDATGEKYHAVYTPIPSTPNWSMAYSISDKDMMAPVNNLTLAILIIIAGSLLLLAIMTYIISSSIVKPVKAAANLANALASGDLDRPIVNKSKDEIGQLTGVLDKNVREAFKNIELAREVAEKQAKYQSEEVDKLVVNLERLSKGELYCDMVVAEPDSDTMDLYELYGRISDNLHLTVNTLRTYIEEISQTLAAMSAGNMSIGIESEYQGDFVAFKDSINSIAESLSHVLSDINIAAEQVASGTRQVSDGSQEISQGATEQASAIEELTATVTQIAEQTKHNAMSANKANGLAISARSSAADGNEQMKHMQAAMTEINDASSNISKIIKVIDDIAFQTNILALNAAVEAARAGAHGKGFAVVAEEVRNLAARSAKAAQETTVLIEGSVKKAEAGTQIADKTAKALADIVEAVENAATLMGEIAIASDQQATGIAQVNNGIEQLSQVVQTNSATSEETAASAEELSSQAELLKEMVGRFTLKDENGLAESKASKHTAHVEAVKEPQILLSDDEFGKY